MVAAEALSIIDASGLDALTVERLATALGVKPATLYYHFAGKEEILEQVARRIVLDAPPPSDAPQTGWQEWLVEVSVGMRERALQHPNAAPLLLRAYTRSSMLGTYERTGRVLEEAGVPAAQQLLLIDGIEKLILGSIVSAVSDLGAYGDALAAADRGFPRLEAMVAATEDGDLFAELVRRFVAGVVA